MFPLHLRCRSVLGTILTLSLKYIIMPHIELSGFVVNADKSVWGPAQIIEWLVFVWNLKECALEIPDKKL